ncbi:MAG: iron-containing alcohol dehydrogenase [Bacilli bacterium]|nr:iron-containing alcohol dehydrogenase [Bacilli bacterium]
MINKFYFHHPVKIYFSEPVLVALRKVLENEKFQRGLIISDPVFENTLALKIKNEFSKVVGLYCEVTPNPLLREAEVLNKLIKAEKCDFLIAIGSGSSLDLAKFAAGTAFGEAELKDYLLGETPFPELYLPLIAIPTTSGTGSEVTAVSVMSMDGNKYTVSSPHFLPHTSIVDPSLTLSLSSRLTAVTGLDALSHALEAFWSIHHQPLTDLYALESCKLIFGNLRKAFDNPDNLEARTALAYASLLAGLAFAQAKTAAVHACSYPLSNLYYLPHGEACTFTLDKFILINASERLKELSKALGFMNLEEMAYQVFSLKRHMGLRWTLHDVGIKDVKELSKACLKHPLMKNNPVKLKLSDLEEMYLSLK